jgi:hypothetical protein
MPPRRRHHQVHDKVYVRDDIFEWLPAIVLEVESDRALVAIQVDYDWDETTVTDQSQQQKENQQQQFSAGSYNQLHLQHRWVYFRDYRYGKLPFQNGRIACRDVVTDLENEYMHEAEILYQIKHRYTRSSRNPYTRVGTIGMIAINNNLVVENTNVWDSGIRSGDNGTTGTTSSSNSLFSIDRQRAYGKRYVTPGTNHATTKSSSDEKKECDTSYSRDNDLLM